MEVRWRLFDHSDLPWAVSQCPFDSYWAGTKVYRAYRAGRRPAPQTTLDMIEPGLVTAMVVVVVVDIAIVIVDIVVVEFLLVVAEATSCRIDSYVLPG
jgi:hypothetical protein